jgi:hypothetical protein
MTTLADLFDADALIRAIRKDPGPAQAVARTGEAIDRAVRALPDPGLEALRLAEEGGAAIKEAIAVLLACEAVPAPLVAPALRPPPRQLETPPARLLIDPMTIAPVGLMLVALPFQSGVIGTIVVTASAGAAGFLAWKFRHAAAPRPAAAFAPPPLPPAPPILRVRPEAIAEVVRRALAQLDVVIGAAERRRAASADPLSLNDTLLEFLQDLLEAQASGNAAYALAKLRFRLPAALAASGLRAVPYDRETADLFDIDGDPAQARTARPAILHDRRCVMRGLASPPAEG